MNFITKIPRMPVASVAGRRGLQMSANKQFIFRKIPEYESTQLTKEQLETFDPECYSFKLRPPTMDDRMEPYGSWKVAHEHERKAANKILMAGVVCFGITLTIFNYSGVLDPLYMPNLDNLMEETQPFDRKNNRG